MEPSLVKTAVVYPIIQQPSLELTNSVSLQSYPPSYDSAISEPSNYALSALPKATGIRGGGGLCTDTFDPGCVICGISPCSACCECTCCHLGGNPENGPGKCYKCVSFCCCDCGCDCCECDCCS